MKKIYLSFLFLLLVTTGFSAQWISISNTVPAPAKAELISSDLKTSTVHFTFDGFNLSEVLTPNGPAGIISIPKGSPVEVSGAPDLPKLTASLIIPDNGTMEAFVVAGSYKDFEGIEVAPSKGVISRETDPSKVPYSYGSEYTKNANFPGTITGMRDPYIMRDLRGQTLIVYPFQYNPVTKTLRVYYDLTVEVRKVSDKGINPLVRKTKDMKVNREFNAVYSRHFLNYGTMTYTPVNDYGNMLVISYGAFMDAMKPYVSWKNAIGIPTTMVSIDSVGTTPAEIRQYITDYYNANGLTFVLLVGDNAQVKTYQGSGVGGASDNYYGYILGNDHYIDVFIGRFSAENADQVNTQVKRTLDYEKNPQFRTDDWLTSVIGIGSDQGPGDDNEYDYQHIRHQQSQLLAYTYTWNPELFDGSQGGNDAPGNPGPNDVTTAVNEGAGVIVYCGHGSMTSWGTTGFSNSNVNGLTNQGKLPFIWSVACVNGQFMNGTCFAEAWLRASKNGEPTGAIAFLGSTINQSWNSPMAGEDEMTDILAESYPTNIKRTFAGLSLNGCALMIDEYGTDGANMADTWTVFGDPSLMVRTSNPDTLIVSHPVYVPLGESSITVLCATNGARATVMLHDAILATGLVDGGSVTLTFPALMNVTDTLLLTVSNYNSIPYQSNIFVLAPVMADFSGTPTNVTTGSPVTFTDLSAGNPVSWKWSFPGGTPDNSTLQNPVVTYSAKGTFDVTLTVSNPVSCDTIVKTNYISADFPALVGEASSELNFSVNPNPNNGTFRISGGSFKGDRVSLRLINTVGTVVYEQKEIEVKDKLDISISLPDLNEGVYFISLKGTTTARTKKVVIRK
ncbi:MAG: C25 family cysteine peptidase [Bacteroidetes bacterium]|nr:C25 family cysteine peptidase [Bacteroidota bacterium]